MSSESVTPSSFEIRLHEVDAGVGYLGVFEASDRASRNAYSLGELELADSIAKLAEDGEVGGNDIDGSHRWTVSSARGRNKAVNAG